VIVNHANSLARRIIRQAQDHRIGAIKRISPGAIILAVRLAQGNQGQIGSARKPRPDLQARRANLAVYEYLMGHALILT
jgi:hypothetical protein